MTCENLYEIYAVYMTCALVEYYQCSCYWFSMATEYFYISTIQPINVGVLVSSRRNSQHRRYRY